MGPKAGVSLFSVVAKSYMSIGKKHLDFVVGIHKVSEKKRKRKQIDA